MSRSGKLCDIPGEFSGYVLRMTFICQHFHFSVSDIFFFHAPFFSIPFSNKILSSTNISYYAHFFIVRSRLLGFGPGGHPSHAYLSPPSRNKYIVKSHLTLIRFRASGVPISRNSRRRRYSRERASQVQRWFTPFIHSPP